MANHLYMNAVGGVHIPRDIGLMDRYLYPPRHRKSGPIITFLMKPNSIRVILLLIALAGYVYVGYSRFATFLSTNRNMISRLSVISLISLILLR